MSEQVTGYDYYLDDADYNSVIVTHWSDGSRTIAKEVRAYDRSLELNGVRTTFPRSESLQALPSTARFIKSHRMGG